MKKPTIKKPAIKVHLKQAHLKQLLSAKYARIAVPAVVAVGLAIAVIPHVMSLPSKPEAMPATNEAYKTSMRNQVQNGSGEPLSGRDPASQGQTSLASAASRPGGVGARTDTPAAGVSGDHSHHATSSQVYGDANASGVNAAGCLTDYGVQGQECLPAHVISSDGTVSCGSVREHFPNGIKVTGTDRYHLDKNGDKTACATSD